MSYSILPQSFYQDKTEIVAQQLLGKFLIHKTPEGTTIGRIVETEAYLTGDPASHAYRGPTIRTAPMFGPAGVSYVYLIYGMYYCLNVTTREEGVGEAVLIRAVEPLSGIPLMQERRKQTSLHLLASGPGRLAQAFGITLADTNKDMTQGDLVIGEDGVPSIVSFLTSPRIGINSKTGAHEELLRYYVADSPFVSPGRKT